jgi:predicted nucleic acid-binding Zn ribbon protein
MSTTLLRLGLWIILIVVALYVLHETYAGLPLEEYFALPMLQKALALGGILIAAGFVTRILEKGAKVVTKNRCVTCRTPVPPGAIYCRAHLRNVLHREDDRAHRTRTRPGF